MQVNNEMIVNESKTKFYEFGLDEILEINAAPSGEPLDYKELNTKINDAISANNRNIVLNNVCGQRFIGAALQGNIKITINLVNIKVFW